MRRRLRSALAVAFLVAATAVAAAAMAFQGNDASLTKPSGAQKAHAPATLTEQIRVDRRDSRHAGCSKRARRLETPDV